MYVSKVNQGINWLFPSARQMFSHSQESRASAQISDMGRQMPKLLTFPPSLFFPQILLLSMMSYGVEYPLGQLGLAGLALSPSQSLAHPQPPLWQSSIKTRKGLAVEAQFGNRWNIPVLSSTVSATNPKLSTVWTKFNPEPKPVQCTRGKKSHCNRVEFFCCTPGGAKNSGVVWLRKGKSNGVSHLTG